MKLPACFDNSFPKGAVSCMAQSKDGFIWLGTNIGLLRYDGYEFMYCNGADSLWKDNASQSVYAIAVDVDDNIWVAFLHSIGCYNPKTNTMKIYNFLLNNKLVTTQPYCIYPHDDKIYLGCSSIGLLIFDRKKKAFESVDIATHARFPYMSELRRVQCNYAHNILPRDKNNFWLASSEGLLSYNIATKAIVNTSPYRNKSLDEFNVISMVSIGNKVWCGGWSSGLSCYDTTSKTWEYFQYDKNKNKLLITVNAIVAKDDHELWIGCMDKGVCTFDMRAKQFNFLNGDSLSKGMTNMFSTKLLFTDEQKNLYAGFLNDLRFFKRSKKFAYEYHLSSYPNRNFGCSESYCFYQSDDKRYLLTGELFADGLVCYDQHSGAKNIVYYIKNGKKTIPDYIEEIMKRDSDNAFVFSSEGVLNYNFKTHSLTKLAVDDSLEKLYSTADMQVLPVSDNGIVWFASLKQGLYEYNIHTQVVKHYEHNPSDSNSLSSNKVDRAIADANGNIWFAQWLTRPLCFMNRRSGKILYFNKEGKVDMANAGPAIHSFCRYKHNVIAATSNGVYIFDSAKEMPVLTKRISKSTGFITNSITVCNMQNDSTLWMHTDHGLYIYNLSNNIFQQIGENDGINGLLVGLRTSNANDVFLCMSKKTYRILPSFHIAVAKPSQPIVTIFSVNDDKLNHVEILEHEKKISINANYSYFTVGFACLDYTQTKDLKYSYMLQGLNNEWIHAGDKRYASFGGINGGNYILKIKCTNNNGYSYSNITEIPIYIETIFYRTLWFRGLIASLLCSLLFAIYHYRTKQKRELDELNHRAQLLEKEKSVVQYENLVQQLNPHFLFNSLTSLSSLISIDPKTARQFVDQMSKIYRYILKSSENETVPLINEINFASTYVKLQQARFAEGFVVNINISEDSHTKKIVPVTIQNMIENAMKHNVIDAESPLVIDIYEDDNYLVVKNNLQKKNIVETSNKHGLNQLKNLYRFLSDREILIEEDEAYFKVAIPLIE